MKENLTSGPVPDVALGLHRIMVHESAMHENCGLTIHLLTVPVGYRVSLLTGAVRVNGWAIQNVFVERET